jgi:hypothetical protein
VKGSEAQGRHREAGSEESVEQRYGRAHVRKLFNRLDRWIVRRIWSHRFKRWRNGGWKQLSTATLYREYGL